MHSERRKNARYLPQSQTFVVLRPQFTTLGKLIDISRGGLSFNYIPLNGDEKDATQLDVFMSDHDFYLSQVRCRIIYEAKDNVAFYFESRRCGVQFGELTQNQADQLERYLEEHSSGQVI